MTNEFFERPIINLPHQYLGRHWELVDGQPTNRIMDSRRRSELITPVPKPKKRKSKQNQQQGDLLFDSGDGLSTLEQGHNPTPIIAEIRSYVDIWRRIPNQNWAGITGK